MAAGYVRQPPNVLYAVGLLGGGAVDAEGGPGGSVPALSVSPNPVRGAGEVVLTLPEAGAVRVAVYDVLGREVARLHDGPLPAGAHELTLDASALPAGVHVVRLMAEGLTESRAVTVAR